MFVLHCNGYHLWGQHQMDWTARNVILIQPLAAIFNQMCVHYIDDATGINFVDIILPVTSVMWKLQKCEKQEAARKITIEIKILQIEETMSAQGFTGPRAGRTPKDMGWIRVKWKKLWVDPQGK